MCIWNVLCNAIKKFELSFELSSRAIIVASARTQHPDSKVHGVNMGPIWGRQDPGGPHVDPMNFAIWAVISIYLSLDTL